MRQKKNEKGFAKSQNSSELAVLSPTLQSNIGLWDCAFCSSASHVKLQAYELETAG